MFATCTTLQVRTLPTNRTCRQRWPKNQKIQTTKTRLEFLFNTTIYVTLDRLIVGAACVFGSIWIVRVGYILSEEECESGA